MKPDINQVIRDLQAAATDEEAADLLTRSGVELEVRQRLDALDLVRSVRDLMPPLPRAVA